MSDEIRGKYRFQHVHHRTTPALLEDIIGFWRRERALPDGDDGQIRSRQVVCLARNTGDEIVGVSSVYVADFLQPGSPHYFYRMFVRPPDRCISVAASLLRLTGETLMADYRPGKPQSLVIVAENPKLWRRGGRRWIAAAGYQPVGKDARGCEVWNKPFVQPPYGVATNSS